MRIDRLLAITTYLLNRDTVTANELATRFEVSRRTIQRDIDAINMAGIPVVSLSGVGGGYQILDTFKLSKSATNQNDINTIRMALKSLNTALNSEQIDTTIEKIDSISSKKNNNITLDFGVAHENKKVTHYLKALEKAINKNNVVAISYINADNMISSRDIEPISLNYKWYAWYLVAYCLEKQDYRIFKLSRIASLSVTNRICTKAYNVDSNLFDKLMDGDNREYIDIEFQFDNSIEHIINEYFPNAQIIKGAGGEFNCCLSVPQTERIWYALLLSFGDDIKIIKPESLIDRVVKDASNIIDKYKGDI